MVKCAKKAEKKAKKKGMQAPKKPKDFRTLAWKVKYLQARPEFLAAYEGTIEEARAAYRKRCGLHSKQQEQLWFKRILEHCDSPPRRGKQLRCMLAKSKGSGRKPFSLTEDMQNYFAALVELCRGPPPSNFAKTMAIDAELHALAKSALAEGAPAKPDALDRVFEEPVEDPEEEKSMEPPAKRQRLDGSRQNPVDLLPVGGASASEPVNLVPPETVVAEAVPHGQDVLLVTRAKNQLVKWDTGEPVKLTYELLVEELIRWWPARFKEKSKSAWYQAVRRWCVRNKLVPRKTNRHKPENPAEVAYRIRELRSTVREYLERHPEITLDQIANVDETSMQVFAQAVKTLHWLGAKCVPGEKTDASRLYINCSVVWWASGRMELVVVYKSKAKDAMKNPRWEYNNGVYWLRAGSKWTNKGTYLEVLRALLSDCKLFSDDHATTHRSAGVGPFVESMGGLRVQVPARATALAQPGDRPGANQALKRILNKVILRWKLKARLEEDFDFSISPSLSKSARDTISLVLSEVVKTMNESHRENIRKTFTQTFLPPGPIHSELKQFLDTHKDAPPPAKVLPDPYRWDCRHGCGESWSAKADEVRHVKSGQCWRRRARVFHPLFERTEATLNAPWSPGLVGQCPQFSTQSAAQFSANNSFKSCASTWDSRNTTTLRRARCSTHSKERSRGGGRNGQWAWFGGRQPPRRSLAPVASELTVLLTLFSPISKTLRPRVERLLRSVKHCAHASRGCFRPLSFLFV